MPLTADDYMEILTLYNRFHHLAEEDKAEEFARLFTPDGVFTIRRPGVTDNAPPDIVHRGPTELAGHIYGHGDKFLKRRLRPTVSNVVIEPSATGARGVACLTVLRVGDRQTPTLYRSGKYVDELVKTADGWRFRSRIYTSDWP